MRIASNHIVTLQPHEIFVFGSNLAGQHGGGAARLAYQKFGAVWGQGVGRYIFLSACGIIPTRVGTSHIQ